MTGVITVVCKAETQAELNALRHAAHQAVASEAPVLRSSAEVDQGVDLR